MSSRAKSSRPKSPYLMSLLRKRIRINEVLGIGRMGPEERKRRKIEIEAERVDKKVVASMVEQKGPVEDNIAKTCSCSVFAESQIKCKHVYLLKQLDRTILVHQINIEELDRLKKEVQEEEKRIAEQTAVVTPVPSNVPLACDVLVNLKNSFTAYLDNPHELTKEQLELLQNSVNNIEDALVPRRET